MTESMSETHDLSVFEHVKRRDWGLGILAWEKSNTRGYVFENGGIRILAQDFYQLMREVDRPHDEVQALHAALSRELEEARSVAGADLPGTKPAVPKMSFDDQLAVFRKEYPGGFQDARWAQTQRGVGAKHRLAGHRDPAIASAAQFAGGALDEQIARKRYRAVWDDLLALLRGSDLVPGPDLEGLEIAQQENQRVIAALVHELLRGEATFAVRLDALLKAFDQVFHRSASWQLATALPALVFPAQHVCVRPSSFREQAKFMAPRLPVPKLPGGASYSRLLSMATAVSARLVDRGEQPRDLMDVHDFIRLTTRPAARKVMLGLKQRAPGAARV
jgi:hypothetical protein